jgi:putative addiction module component (TIGR02574 family)
MMGTVSALLEKIRSDVCLLPIEEQQVLAVDLFDASWGAYEPASEVEVAWNAEVTKRADEIHSGKATVIPWTTVQTDLAKEFGWDK